MSLEGKMKSGRLYCEFGHELEENKAYEQKIQYQRVHCKELVYDYNQTRPVSYTHLTLPTIRLV